ncbi:MAG TPA: RNA 3'-terminal phosphate cyclase [Pirellulaceae bacterium]|nr:RNA 3'-terminal phosphate cyclase [Pirellulaceae bacterium]
MTSVLHINGSQGEGGGQIVRSSLALALVTGRSITIDNIRAGREKPGLMRQHLTAVKAAAEICGGMVSGAETGSTALRFEPLPAKPGQYRFSVGTAGSATLVLQTILPALLIADGPSELILEGGTHNQWAPPFDFLQKAFLPLVNRMGPRVSATLERHGFYPAGGGRFRVTIEPSATLAGFDLLERGPITSRSGCALVSNLPLHIAEREVQTLLRKMTWDESCGAAHEVEAHGPGNVVCLEIGSEQVTEIFTGFGRNGVKAERIADEVVRQARDYLQTNAAVGPYLADQIMLPLGISAWQQSPARRQRGGSFLTLALTRHATTHIEILRQFLDIDIRTEAVGNTCRVTLRPNG